MSDVFLDFSKIGRPYTYPCFSKQRPKVTELSGTHPSNLLQGVGLRNFNFGVIRNRVIKTITVCYCVLNGFYKCPHRSTQAYYNILDTEVNGVKHKPWK